MRCRPELGIFQYAPRIRTFSDPCSCGDGAARVRPAGQRLVCGPAHRQQQLHVGRRTPIEGARQRCPFPGRGAEAGRVRRGRQGKSHQGGDATRRRRFLRKAPNRDDGLDLFQRIRNSGEPAELPHSGRCGYLQRIRGAAQRHQPGQCAGRNEPERRRRQDRHHRCGPPLQPVREPLPPSRCRPCSGEFAGWHPGHVFGDGGHAGRACRRQQR
jgi:hypothetical protein